MWTGMEQPDNDRGGERKQGATPSDTRGSAVGKQTLEASKQETKVETTPAHEVEKGPRTKLTVEQLFGGTLAELRRLTDDQADWANHVDGDPKELETLWQWRDRSHDEALLTGSGGFALLQLIEHVAAHGEALAQLRAYGQTMTQSPPTARLHEPVGDLATACKLGTAVLELGQHVGHPVLATIMPHPKNLLGLVEANKVKAFVDYHDQAKPLLHAVTGKEVDSFLAMEAEGMPWQKYLGSLGGRVRNIHRFENKALAALESNLADRSRSRPLALVLHTALDARGAYHRNSHLTKLLARNSHVTLLVEGATSLDQLGGAAESDAKAYGPKGQIDQVLLAGHGESDAMELAGDTRVARGENGHDQLTTDAKQLKVKDKDSELLIQRLLAVMSPKTQDHRMVLDACLTASKQVPSSAVKQDPDEEVERQQIRDYGKQNPSLVEWIDGLARDKHGSKLDKLSSMLSGTPKPSPIDVVGARAKTFSTRTEFVSKGGTFGLSDSEDPQLTGSEQAYLAEGIEPMGVMIALVRQWTANPEAARKVVEQRVAKPRDATFEFIITALLEIALKYWNNGPVIASLAESASALFASLGPNECSPYQVLRVPKLYLAEATTAMAKYFDKLHGPGFPHYVVSRAQALLRRELDDGKELIAALNDAAITPSCAPIARYVDSELVQPHLDKLLELQLDRGCLVLALIAIRRGIATERTLELVRRLGRSSASELTEPAQALIAGFCSPSVILAALNKQSVTRKVPANADPGATGTNALRIETCAGTATARDYAAVHDKPTDDANVIANLKTGMQVPLVGKIQEPAGWCAVRLDNRVAYARTKNLKLPA